MQAAGLHDTHYLKRNFDDKAKSSSFFLIKDRSSCLWLPLFPTEQTRIIRLLVRRVTVTVRRRMIWNRGLDFGLEGSGSVG